MTEETETLPFVAEILRRFLPELKGRAFPVTEAEITKDNVPTLPLGMVAPLRQDFTHNGGLRVTVVENFILEIWLEPARIKGEKGETPFWSYYEYNAFRDRLFALFAAIRSPQGGTFRFVSMDVDSTYLATMLSFRMTATYDTCVNQQELEKCEATAMQDGLPAQITFALCRPRSQDCGKPEPEEEKNPCP
ncbi:hypothetical protein [Synechococcus phage Ssp-JY38]|nr:hypothetical protein [Synechococcus phage Yong-L2-223]